VLHYVPFSFGGTCATEQREPVAVQSANTGMLKHVEVSLANITVHVPGASAPAPAVLTALCCADAGMAL
jgi:hypothetical protein